MINIARIWQELSGTKSDGAGWKSRRIDSRSPCTVRAAMGEPGEEPALLFEVPSLAIDPPAEFPEGSGFRLFSESINPGPHGTVRLCLVLADQAYLEVFGALAEDVVEAVEVAATEGDGIRIMLKRLRAWQAFMKRGTGGLSSIEQSGLFSEILALGDLIDAGLDAGKAVGSWTGPLPGLRDFAIGPTEIEVKASVGTGSSRFHVSHLEQLDETMTGTLLLLHYALAEDAGGKSLPEVIEEMRRRLARNDPTALLPFELLLISAGYSKIHDRRYGRKLARKRKQIFKVQGNFPRLLRSEVRPGILDADYSVDVQSCATFEIDDKAAMRDMLEGISRV